jgi:hypothetical protein
MVKVLSKDSNNLRCVARHLNYIGRHGELELETDAGMRLQQRKAGDRIVEDWDLDLDRDRGDSRLSAGTIRAPKLIHKVVLSMPPGTAASGVLEAARNFAREEFALKHRYALTLHTDEPHPHVHLVVKAVSEQGIRLNIRKSILRHWRREFARHLREQGIAANATERAVRGENRAPKTDGIYRAILRGQSSHMRARVEAVRSDCMKENRGVESGKERLTQTRRAVERGWQSMGDNLLRAGYLDLAAQVTRFLAEMPPVRTEKEALAAELGEKTPDREMRWLSAR